MADVAHCKVIIGAGRRKIQPRYFLVPNKRNSWKKFNSAWKHMKRSQEPQDWVSGKIIYIWLSTLKWEVCIHEDSSFYSTSPFYKQAGSLNTREQADQSNNSGENEEVQKFHFSYHSNPFSLPWLWNYTGFQNASTQSNYLTLGLNS